MTVVMPISAAADALVVEALDVTSAETGALLVHDVTFRLAVGEVLGIVGESGSGKTTTGLACLGHAKPGTKISAGDVTLGDQSLLQLDASLLRKLRRTDLSYVPQAGGFSLNPALTLRSQLMPLLDDDHRRDVKTRRILDMFGRVALPSDEAFLKRYPHQLSGGQQQRVVIAAALLCRPSVVVLDEPTTGLDVNTQGQIVALLSELCKSDDIAAIFITHDLSAVAELCDRIAVMYAGKIVELGPSRSMLQQPSHPYTRGLLQSVPDIAGGRALIGMAGRPPLPGATAQGCSFAPRCSQVQARCREETPPQQSLGDRVVGCFFPILEGQAGAQMPTEPPNRKEESVPSSRPSPLLEVSVLKAFHGQAEILRDIDIGFEAGSCTGIVGESGSGKTTLSRVIAGIHRNYDGTVRLDGSSLAPSARHRTEEEKQKVQYIFQNPYDALNPRRKVWQALVQPIRDSIADNREGRKRALELLDLVGLGPQLVDRFPVQLSGGELQRVAIARALATEPSILICDEVTSALDVSVQASIVGLLKNLQKQRDLTIIFVTHNIALVRYLADTIAVLKDGVILEHSGTERIFEDAEAAYTRSLIRAVPDLWRSLGAWDLEDSRGK